MKWYKFTEKMPEIGTNIIISTPSKSISIIHFSLDVRKYLGKNLYQVEYSGIDYFNDDHSEDGEYCLSCAKYWCYPSSIELPKDNK